MLRVEPNQNVNPDEVVAIGAAVQAGILGGELKDILLLDVTPVSIGLETVGGLMKKIIPRNTTIPVRRTDVFSTSEDNQTSVEINIVQGERELANGNRALGRFKLMGIPPAPRGIPQVQVSFDIDANGILQVTAMDRTTGREQSITIQGASTLSEDEVQQMIRLAQEFAETDRLRKEKIDKRNRSETLIVQSERQLREATLDFGMQFVSPYRSRIEPSINRLRGALESNNERDIDIAEADLRDALYDLQREIYDRNQEEKDEGGFFKAVKDFFLDDEDDYYYDNYAGGYGYNRGALDYGRSNSIGSLPYAGGSAYGRDASGQSSRDSYGRDSYGRDSYSQGGAAYGRDAAGQGGRDVYDRDAYGQSGRDTYDQDYGRDRSSDRRDPSQSRGGYDDRGYSQGGYDDVRYDRANDYYDQSSRNTRRKPDRPDYSRDNWDDDDW